MTLIYRHDQAAADHEARVADGQVWCACGEYQAVARKDGVPALCPICADKGLPRRVLDAYEAARATT